MREHEITVVPTVPQYYLKKKPFSGEKVDEHVRAVKKRTITFLNIIKKYKTI